MKSNGLSEELMNLADSLEVAEDHELRVLSKRISEAISGRHHYQETLDLYKKALNLMDTYRLELDRKLAGMKLAGREDAKS